MKKKIQVSNQPSDIDDLIKFDNEGNPIASSYSFELRVKCFEDLQEYLKQNEQNFSSYSQEKLHSYFL